MISKKDYLENASARYDKLIAAEKAAKKLEKKIAKIRAQGFKLIVLGAKVKVTYP